MSIAARPSQIGPIGGARNAGAGTTPAAKGRAVPSGKSNILRRLPGLAFSRPDILAASFGSNLLALGLPIVMLQAYDRIIPNQATDTLSLLMAGLALTVVLDTVLRIVRARVTAWSAARFEHALNKRLIDRMLDAPLTAFERDAVGVHLDRFGAIDTLRDFYGGQAILHLVDLPFVVIFLMLIGFIGGPLIIVPVVVMVISAALTVAVGRNLSRALRERATLDDRRYNFIIEVLNGIHNIKGLAIEKLMVRRYERLQASSAQAASGVAYHSGMSQTISAMSANVSMIALAAFGAVLVLDQQMTMGALAACTLLGGRAIQPLLRAVSIWTQFQSIEVAENRISGIADMPSETAGEFRDPGKLAGAIRLEHVTYAYGGDRNAPILRDVSMDIAPGETVSIAGDNGSGKSTLLRVMSGLIQPSSGTLKFDIYPSDQLHPRLLRDQIAYLPQYSSLFRGTLLDNLTMFRGQEAMESALELSRKLGLEQTIARLPDGLDTWIGDNMTYALPGGVRTKIALVRALVGEPRIVLFDEANSGFDKDSDELLRNLLLEMRGTVTMVVASHRPSLLNFADRRLQLVNGQLVTAADGPPRPAAKSGQVPATVQPSPTVQAAS